MVPHVTAGSQTRAKNRSIFLARPESISTLSFRNFTTQTTGAKQANYLIYKVFHYFLALFYYKML
jgi:hypothetical protein